MPRADVPTFINGDRLEDAEGRVAYVRQCRGGAKGTYLKAVIVSGAGEGQWVWPEKFCRRPAIDWAKDGPPTVCRDCERLFVGGVDASGLRRLWCRTCEGFQASTETRQSKDAGPPHRFGANRPRVHRRTATDDVEDQIAASTRGQS